MLIPLAIVALVWIAVACVVIAACRIAARGDAAMLEAAERTRRRATLAGVVMWEQPEPVGAADLRPSSRPLDDPIRAREAILGR
jgi:hypothetical protein